MAQGRKRTVLVVDDDRDTVVFFRTLLEDAGFRITTAASVIDALRLAEYDPPDALVSDIAMPEGSGTSLLSAFRRREEFRRIPIIVVSGYPRDSPIYQGRNFEWDHYLQKPVDGGELIAVLNDLLDRPPES